MTTSEPSNLEDKIASLVFSLSSLRKGLTFLAVLILLVLMLLAFNSVRELLNATQTVDSTVQTTISQQSSADLANAETVANLNETLTQELQNAEETAIATQRSLEEARAQLEASQAQLEEARAQFEGAQTQLEEAQVQLAENQTRLAENQTLLAENQTQLAAARQALQQALPSGEELIRVRQELAGQREEASARTSQYLEDLEGAQRQIRDLQFQRNQLQSDLAALRESPAVIETPEVRIADNIENISSQIDEPVEPVEQAQSLVDTPETDRVVPGAIVAQEATVAQEEIVVPEEIVSRAQPTYPRRAVNRNIEGSCELEFTVTTDGEVIDPVVVESEPPRVFDDACLEAISDFEYSPKTINGVPVEAPGARMTFRFSFR